MSTEGKILFIEKDRELAAEIHSNLRQDGFLVDTAFTAKEGFNKIRRSHFDLIIMNTHYPSEEISCNAILKLISQQYYKVPIILTCEDVSSIPSSQSIPCHIFSFFRKPINYKLLKSTIIRALEQSAGNKFKEDLLAMFSHDVKTPLTSIIGYSSILMSGKCGEFTQQAYEYITKIASKGRKILLLTEDFLTSCNIDADQIILHKSPTQLNTVIEDVLSDLEILISEKNLTISFTPGELNPINVDEIEIERVFTNLIYNAIKFANRGGRIIISTTTVQPTKEEDISKVAISVSNTGPGISKEEMPFVFHKYKHLKGGDTASGFGLGLYIVKFLIEEHQGEISLTSEPNELTTFTVKLPVT